MFAVIRMLIGMMYEHNASSPNYGIAEKIIELGKNLILKLENILKNSYMHLVYE